MIASKIGTSDIVNIGAFGKLEVVLPDYAAVETAKNLVTRAKKRYPRKDGLTWTCKTTKGENKITIECLRPEEVEQRKIKKVVLK